MTLQSYPTGVNLTVTTRWEGIICYTRRARDKSSKLLIGSELRRTFLRILCPRRPSHDQPIAFPSLLNGLAARRTSQA